MSILGKGEFPGRMELTAFQKVKGGQEDSSRGCRRVSDPLAGKLLK